MFEWVVPYLVQGNPNRQAMFLQCRGALSLPHRRQIYLMHHNRMLPRMAYQTWPHWTQTIQLIEIHTLHSTVLHNNTTVFHLFWSSSTLNTRRVSLNWKIDILLRYLKNVWIGSKLSGWRWILPVFVSTFKCYILMLKCCEKKIPNSICSTDWFLNICLY